jgi:hypothetical protein
MAASRWQAAGCLTSALGRKSDGKKEASVSVALFIVDGERELGGGPLQSASDAGVAPDR